MSVPKIIRCFAMAFIAVSISCYTHAQEISKEEKTSAVQAISKHIAEHYVYTEKGGQIASYIQMANHKGEFDKAATWQEFDSLVTKSLRKFSGDGHLYVKYDPAIVRELKSPASQKDTQEMGLGEQRSKEDNYGFKESKVLDKNIGYLKITEISLSKKSLPALYEAMRKVENTTALIIDLRDNGGGGSTIGSVLESYFLPAGTPLLEFTSRQGTQFTDSAVNWLEEKKYDKPVYIIVNKKTASAAEAFAFVLQQNKRAKIVGESSAGAANMNQWFAINDENYVSVSTAAPTIPGYKQLSWEQEGIKPDMRVKSGDPVQYIISKL